MDMEACECGLPILEPSDLSLVSFRTSDGGLAIRSAGQCSDTRNTSICMYDSSQHRWHQQKSTFLIPSYSILFHLTTSYSSYFGGKKGISRNKTSFFLLMGTSRAASSVSFFTYINRCKVAVEP